MKVKFKRFSSRARVLQKATIGSACYDFFAARCVTLEPGPTRSVETDLGFCFSKKYMARIYLRSSLSLQSVLIGGGVVDSNYRGNTRVIMTNLSDRTIEFETGDRIAQVLFMAKEEAELEEVSSLDDFQTDRGSKGFGSSGR